MCYASRVGLFGRREVTLPGTPERISALEAEVSKLASALRQLETEQATMHDHVRRWMRRAVAAERRVEARNQELDLGQPGAQATPVAATPAPRRTTMWGARRRIAERAARQALNGTGGASTEPAETEE